MALKIKSDVSSALADWRAGKPVRALELGHTQRMIERPGASSVVSDDFFPQNQDRAYAYCFAIIEYCTAYQGFASSVLSWEEFNVACGIVNRKFLQQNADLTPEERDGAESLAWKALRYGWARAIEGHTQGSYIEVTRPQAEKKLEPPVQAT